MASGSRAKDRLLQFLSAVALAAVFTLGLARSARAGDKDDVLAACAAFAPDGSSVTAVADAANLSAEITESTGTTSPLTLPLSYPATDMERASGQRYSCHAYFDNSSGLIAIGLSYGFAGRFGLRVGVADLAKRKWVGEWTVGPTSGMFKPLLLGFLESTTSVVVAGEPSAPTNYGPGRQHGAFSSLLFNPQGQQLSPMPTVEEYGSVSDFFPFHSDARHNRLWIFRCVVVSAPAPRQPDCPVSWRTLIGASSASPEFDPRKPGDKRTDFWTLPGTFAAPDDKSIVVAEGDKAWLVDLQEQVVERLAIPKRFHFPNFEDILGAAAISPDEKFVALPLVKESLAFPYLADNYVYKGTDFAVIQLHPFQLLGILPGTGPRSLVSCAIDDREGRVVALIFHRDHWERTELNPSPKQGAVQKLP
jgi:hypothetical protein